MLRSIIDLQAAINRNLEQHNDDPKPFIWTKPAYPILAKLDRLPVPLRGSLLTLRWRKQDSNRRSLATELLFPAEQESPGRPLYASWKRASGATIARLMCTSGVSVIVILGIIGVPCPPASI